MSDKYAGFLTPVKKPSSPQQNQKGLKSQLELSPLLSQIGGDACGNCCGCESTCKQFEFESRSRTRTNPITGEEYNGHGKFLKIPDTITWDVLDEIRKVKLPVMDSNFIPLVAVNFAKKGSLHESYQIIFDNENLVHPIRDVAEYINAYVDRVMCSDTRKMCETNSYVITGFYAQHHKLNTDIQKDFRRTLCLIALSEIAGEAV